MGIGCNGVIKVLLQRLDAASGYEPFQTIAACHLHRQAAVCATVVHSEYPGLPGGATLIDWAEDYAAWQIPDRIRAPLRQHCAGMLSTTAPQLVEQTLPTGNCTLLYAPIKPIPRLLVLGAGPDAVPLVNMAIEIGWRVTVADHRAAYLEEPAFRNAHEIVCIEPKQLEKTLTLDKFSAVVVMSHHLETDRSYLNQLACSNIAYVGVLGPRARRDRLISELDRGEQKLAGRLKGPVGLSIGADSPESIALSILAEIHQTISSADN